MPPAAIHFLSNSNRAIRPNHEKVLYTKLLRFKQEQLENWDGQPIEYSTSDYHHAQSLQRARKVSTRASLQQGPRGQKRQSQYSLADNHLVPPRKSQSQNVQRRTSVAETDESYDPFRPSRNQITKAQADHAKITVLRAASHASGKGPSVRTMSKPSIRNPAIERARQQEAYSIASSPTTMHSAGSSQLQRMVHSSRPISRVNSRVTVGSKRSVGSNSSVIIARNSASWKRNVSFVHNRRKTSKGQPRLRVPKNRDSPMTLQERYVRDRAPSQDKTRRPSQTQVEPQTSSPLSLSTEIAQLDMLPVVRSRKSPTKHGGPSGSDDTRPKSHQWKDEVRKFSTEAEKLCDEAFNRSSMASSAPTANTRATGHRVSQQSYPSPATSFSICDESAMATPRQRAEKGSGGIHKPYEERPLPKPPSADLFEPENAKSYTHRELAKTKEILQRRARDSCMEPGYLDDIIAHLDRLMQPSQIRLQDEERRAVSAPDAGPRIARRDTFDQIIEKGDIGFRSVTAPEKRKKTAHKDTTIRLVDGGQQGPISPIKPLQIRKKSETSTPAQGSSHERRPTQQQFPPSDPRHYRGYADNGRNAGLALLDNRNLAAIEETEDKENVDPMNRKMFPGEPKKRRWFQRHNALQRSRDTDIGPPPSPSKDKDQRLLSNYQDLPHRPKNPISTTIDHSRPSDNRKALSSKGRFFKMLSNKYNPKDSTKASSRGDYDLDDGASISTEASSRHLSVDLYMAGALDGSTRNVPKQKRKKTCTSDDRNLMPPLRDIIQPPQNWLSRFLRIKPAVSVMCFQVGKVRARREIAALFREWRKYGMRDIVIDKVAGRIWARVDAKNCKSSPFVVVPLYPISSAFLAGVPLHQQLTGSLL